MICNCPKCLYAPAPTVNELQQRIEELALSPTEFECVNMDGKIVVLDSKTIPTGTLIGYGDKREAFRALAFDALCRTHKYEIIDPGHRVFN